MADLSRIPLVVASSLILATAAPTSRAQLTPEQAIVQMGRGINLGNTLEPPTEGGWNNGPAEEYYFDDYLAAGFSTVRIPVRWDEHTLGTAPFTIQDAWLDRVEEIVDWGLARDFIIIINGHHEDWLKQNYAHASTRARYDSIWSQIATRFKDKSDRLLFEIINEPFGMTAAQVDDLNARILGIIRRTNPTRIVIYSGNEWSGSSQMMTAAVPNDDYIMAYFHSYDPWSFAGEAQGVWGSEADRAAVHDQFERVAAWSGANGVPVMISEFGAVRAADFNSRMAYYATYVDAAVDNNIATQVWDDGGDFGIYLRDDRDWNEIKDILISSYPDGPTALHGALSSDSIVTLSWSNRSTTFAGIRVERRTGSGPFEEIAHVGRDATEFSDSTVSGGLMYYYRVIAESGLLEERVSYPIRVHVAPWVRSSFNGIPGTIPGVIEAEDYDVGGEGLTYHDTDEENIAGAYRPTEAVDIEERNDGGFQVAYIASGEWLEYTVDVAKTGEYLATAYVASRDGGGRLRFEFDGVITRTLTVPATGDWQTLVPVSRSVSLGEGEQVMRIAVFAGAPFNIDRFVIEEVGSTALEELPAKLELAVYPNPVSSMLTVRSASGLQRRSRAEVVNTLGQRVGQFDLRHEFTSYSVGHLACGVYVVRVYHEDSVVASVPFVRL